jgi:hypothetical protein
MAGRYQTLTLDQWVEAGKKIKKISVLLEELLYLVSGKIPSPLTDRILKLYNPYGPFSRLKSRLEDEMFRQHPGLSNEHLSAFYGAEDEESNERAARVDTEDQKRGLK